MCPRRQRRWLVEGAVVAWIGATLVVGCRADDAVLTGGQEAPEAADPLAGPSMPEPVADGSQIRELQASDLGVEQRLESGVAHHYRLFLKKDQLLHLRIDQMGTDLITLLMDPAQQPVIQVDSHASPKEPEYLYVVTSSNGLHTLVIRPLRPEAQGSYRVKVVERRQARSIDRQCAAAELAYAQAYALAETRPAGTVPELVVDGYLQAVQEFHELGLSHREAVASFELATIYRDGGFKDEALAFFQRSIERNVGLRYRNVAHNEVGMILRGRGDPAGARRSFEMALELSRQLEDARDEAAALQNLGRLDSRQGHILDALDKLRQAERFWREVGDRIELNGVLDVTGEVYRKFGEPQRALDYHRQALELLDPHGEPLERATTLSFIGQSYLANGELDRAAEAFAECLRLRQQGGGTEVELAKAWAGLGVVEERRRNPQRALELFQKALGVFRQRNDLLLDYATILNNIAWIHNDLGELTQALELHRQALELYRLLEDHEGRALSLRGLAVAYRRLGQELSALDYAEQALAQIEELLEAGQAPAAAQDPQDLQLSFLASRQPFFDFYIDLLMEQHELQPEAGYDALALAVSEQARARHLLEILGESSLLLRETVDPELQQQRRLLRAEINAADLELRRQRMAGEDEDLDAAERRQHQRWAEYRRLVQRMRERSPGYEALQPPRPLALPEIRQLLDHETILLEYHIGRNRAFLWAAGKDWMESYELPPPAKIERAAGHARRVLLSSDRIHHRIAAEQAMDHLAGILLAPVADRLAGQRLLIVSHGALEYIPFAALPIPGSPRRRLVEDHEIVNAPSASVLAMLRHRRRRPEPQGLLAVVSDAVFSASDPRLGNSVQPAALDEGLSTLSRIPHSGREARAIIALAADRGKVFEAAGFDARREVATSGRLGDFRILHFATHGILREDVPELSALVFSRYAADGRVVEGRLPLIEVYDLDLAADLVVLSACQSALGRQIRGEGLMGLPRGFLYAGSQRVIASLWSIQDQSTAELMARFYHHLLVEEQPLAAALRAAQRSMLAERRYGLSHWAGFVLMGDWL